MYRDLFQYAAETSIPCFASKNNRLFCWYEGKKYIHYRATRMQRRIERTVRKVTRERDAAEAAGLKEQRQRMKVEYPKTDLNENNTRGIITKRKFALGLRKPPSHILTDLEIAETYQDADALGIDRSVLKINTGDRTAFSEFSMKINIRGDILPDNESTNPRDRMSQRAVLAHEYYGHYLHHPSSFEPGDWRDEFRASYRAAIDAPSLSDEDRTLLMLDAFERAKEAGVSVRYNTIARRVIHGYFD